MREGKSRHYDDAFLESRKAMKRGEWCLRPDSVGRIESLKQWRKANGMGIAEERLT